MTCNDCTNCTTRLFNVVYYSVQTLQTPLSLSFQAVVVYEILNYVESPDNYELYQGVGLSFAMFSTEFLKAYIISLMWALNLRTAVRLKGAFSAVAYQKVISLRVTSSVSMGEVKIILQTQQSV